MLSFMCPIGLPFGIKYTSLRGIVYMRSLFCMVIVTLYCGNLMAHFTVYNAEIPINSLRGLADSSYDIYLRVGGATQQLMQVMSFTNG